MKSLSTYVSEAFVDVASSKFITIAYQDSSETGNIWNAAIGYIDASTTLSYCVPIDQGLSPYFRLTTGKKFHDSDKRNWSKRYSTIEEVPAKFANHAAELVKFMDGELLIKSIDDDPEFQEFMDESFDFSINGTEDLISRIVNACKSSGKFLQRLLLILDDTVTRRNVTKLNEAMIFERSWFAAIATNYLLYIAATQVAKISNKWLRTLLLALIAERVITTNDLGPKLKRLLNL